MKLSKIKPNPNNPRIVKDDKFKKLVKSIKEFPKMMELRPMVIDKEGIVLGGNMRLKALKELGYKDIPPEWVKFAKDLTEEEKKRFIIADNVGFGLWDWDQLANEWDEEQLIDWGLDIPDFETEELEAVEDDYSEPEQMQVDIMEGDLVEFVCEDGRVHRLLCGDSTCSDSVGKLMDGKKADMVFTDPPYNIGYSGTMSRTSIDGVQVRHVTMCAKYDDIENDKVSIDDFGKFIASVLKVIKLNCKGAYYICFGSQSLNQLLTPLEDLGIKYKSIIIWVKNQSTISGKDYKGRYEPIVYGRFNDDFHGKRYFEEDVWEFQKTLKNDLHPTMKPIPLCSKAITDGSKKNGSVLDLFGGSGSTMVASHGVKRVAFLMELTPKYCQVIIDRMQKLDNTLTVKINGKEYKKEGAEVPF